MLEGTTCYLETGFGLEEKANMDKTKFKIGDKVTVTGTIKNNMVLEVKGITYYVVDFEDSEVSLWMSEKCIHKLEDDEDDLK
jgi:hypothetical protein